MNDVQTLTARDTDQIQRLFGEVFGTPLSPAMWHWKYGDGRGRAMGMFDASGKLVTHYGGIRRPYLCDRQTAMAMQMVDVMVAPAARGVFSRRGPFGRTAQAFLAATTAPKSGVDFWFGLPGDRHLRLGRLLDLYPDMDEMSVCRWHLDATPSPTLRCEAQPLDWEAPQTQVWLDRLGQAFSDSIPGVLHGRRDHAWWRYRFASHPHWPYQAYWLLEDGCLPPIGAFVIKTCADGEGPELMDWMAPHARLTDVLHLAAAMLHIRHGLAPAFLLWSSQRVRQALPPTLLAQARIERVCQAVAQAQVMGQASTAWRDRVWLTGGDTDFR